MNRSRLNLSDRRDRLNLAAQATMAAALRSAPVAVQYCRGDCEATTMSTSTCGSFAVPLNLNVMPDAAIGLKAMECSIVTCDTDMLTMSSHRPVDDDDTALADAAHIYAADAAAEVPVDLPRDSPSS